MDFNDRGGWSLNSMLDVRTIAHWMSLPTLRTSIDQDVHGEHDVVALFQSQDFTPTPILKPGQMLVRRAGEDDFVRIGSDDLPHVERTVADPMRLVTFLVQRGRQHIEGISGSVSVVAIEKRTEGRILNDGLDSSALLEVAYRRQEMAIRRLHIEADGSAIPSTHWFPSVLGETSAPAGVAAFQPA